MRILNVPVPFKMAEETLPKEVFKIEELPVELKHEVLKYIKTSFLEDVCSRVSRHWEEMVRDIVNQRVAKVEPLIPPHIRSELELRLHPDKMNDPVKLLRSYEQSMLRKKFNVHSFQASANALSLENSIFYKVWKMRRCECSTLDECIVRAIHLMPVLDLCVVQAVRELKFFHIDDLERSTERNHVAREYECDADGTWFENDSDTDISIYRDHIVAEETSRALLLFKVAACDHENRSIRLERIRRIFLPIWSRSLCLFSDKIFILYSTGFIGMWDKENDDLSISDNVCGHSRNGQAVHSSQMFRIANLLFIKTLPNNTYVWHVVEADDPSLLIHSVEMAELVTAGFLAEEPPWECTEVYYIGIWCNCFLVHCEVQSLITGRSENRLMLKRILRYPLLQDFLQKHTFRKEFLSDSFRGTKSTILDGSIMAPFLPTFSPWELEPHSWNRIPVADIFVVIWPTWDRRKHRKLKINKINISNLPSSRALRATEGLVPTQR